MPLAVYAHTRFEPGDPRTGRMIDLANAAYRDCGSQTTEKMRAFAPALWEFLKTPYEPSEDSYLEPPGR